jgi:hypothetical protein
MASSAARPAAALALALGLACSGDRPAAPTRPDDCVYFNITVPTTLNLGQTAPLGAFRESCRPMFLPIDPALVVWTSLDPGVAAIGGTSVTGTSAGIAVLQGTHGDMSAQALVRVGAPQPAPGTPVRLRLLAPPVMAVGQRSALTLYQELSNATVVNVSGTAQFQSSNPAVVAVLSPSAIGVEIHAFQSGSSTMTATHEGRRVTVEVRVAR